MRFWLSGFLRRGALVFLLTAGGLAMCAQQTGTPAAQQQAADRRFLLQRGIGPAAGAPSTAAAPPQRLAAVRVRVAATRALHPLSSAATAAQPFSGANSVWQAAGPLQVNTAAYGLVTGRISSLAVDTNDATGSIVYLGATGGGVWKSTNANASDPSQVTFTPLTDNSVAAFANSNMSVPSLSIGAITVQPGNPNVLLAGTGDPNDSLDSYYGVGILRSGDAGVTWTLIPGSRDQAMNGGFANYSFAGNGFAGFAWSTANPNLVVAAVSQSTESTVVNTDFSNVAERGLYYSTDAGKTWLLGTLSDGGQIFESPNYGYGPPGNAATAVVWNKQRQLFVAAIRYHGYYSSPDGVTWTRLAQQPGANLSTTQCPARPGGTGSQSCPIFRGALAVQPATGDTFALTIAHDSNTTLYDDQGLYQDVCSTSGTASSSCNSGALAFGKQIDDAAIDDPQNPGTIPQADYNLALSAVSSQQDTILFAGTEDIFRCSLANSCQWRNTTNDQTCSAAGVAPSTHAIDGTDGASGLIYFGTDGGVWRSTDTVSQTGSVCAATDASHFQNLNSGIGSLAEISHLAVSPSNGSLVLAGMGEFGVVASESSAAQAGTGAWQQLLTGEGSLVAIDPNNPSNWFADSGPGVSIYSCASGGNCDAAGFGAAPVIGRPDVEDDADYFFDSAPWMLDPLNPANIILGTCRMWLGPVTGKWSSANLLSTMLDGNQGSFCDGNAQLRSVGAGGSYNSAQGGEQMYAGMAGQLDGGGSVPGHIYGATVPQSGGQAGWSDLERNPVTLPATSTSSQFNPDGYAISSIAVDPHDATGKTLYVGIAGFPTGQGGVIYGSTDGGAHWANLSNSLPFAPVNSIVVDPGNPSYVYVGGDFGVYYTQNIANCSVSTVECWGELGSGLPTAPVTGLQAYSGAQGTVLEASTYGRGIWTVGLSTTTPTLAQGSLSPASYTFALGQAVGSQSPTVASFTLSSSGSVALNIAQIAASGDYAQTNTCGASLSRGQSCSIHVTFKPSAVGDRTGTLTVHANVSGGVLSSTLDGTGLTPGAITVSPASGLVFPVTATGATSAPMNVTVSNTGGAPVTLGASSITGTNTLDFSVAGGGNCGSTLAANASCTVAVVFNPVQTGPRAAQFQIVSSATGSPFMVSLSGRAIAPAFLTLTPTSLSFSPTPQKSASAAQTITVTNTGGADAQLDPAIVSSDYTLSANGCGSTLAGGAMCTVSIEFTPLGTGTRPGLFSLSSPSIPNGETSPKTAQLSGTGLQPASVSLSPAAYTFAAQQQGTTSATEIFTVTNSAGSAAALGTPTVSGPYALASSSCPASLAVGSTCQLGVTFTPTAPGPISGKLTLPFNGSSSASATLSGTGTAPATLTFSPGSLSFGTIAENTTAPAQSVIVTNSGGTPAQITSVTITVAFAIVSSDCPAAPQQLQINASCTLQVNFTPPDTAAYRGSVTLNGNFSPAPAQIVLTGQGATPAAATLTPPTFPSTDEGALSAPQNLVITSTGGVPLTFGAQSITAEFQIASNGCTDPLPPGRSCNVAILFHPSGLGARTGTFTQASNAPGGPLTAPLNGTGLAPGKLTLTPATFAFGSEVIGTATAAQPFTVQNTGEVTVAVGTPVLSSSDYLLTGACPATLAPSASCTLTVSFRPTMTGDRPGQLTIPGDGSGTPVSATLDGTGTTPGQLSFNPSSLAFGSVAIGSTANATTTVTNSGGTSVHLSAITATGDFSVTGGSCAVSTAIAAGGASGSTCTVTVAFTPSADGSRSGTLALVNDGSPNPAQAGLAGVGVAPGNLSLSPATVQFGSVVLNTTPAPQATITATNSGGVAITLGAPSIDGNGYSLGSTTCGSTLGANSNCTIQVMFSPTAAGDSPGVFSLSGAGVTRTVSLDGNGVTPGALAFTPSSVVFGPVVIGSAPTQSLVMKNTGGASVSLGAVAASAPFTLISQCGGSLAPSASCTLQVTFRPASAESFSGLLTVQSSVSGGAPAVPLSGSGVAPGSLAASGPLSFPSTTVGSRSAAQTATFRNTGGVSVTLAAPLASSDYSITSNGCGSSLEPNAVCTVSVAFAPTAAGDRPGTLTLAGSAAGGPVARVTLDGSGLAPARLAFMPGSLAFGGQPARTTSASQSLMLQNAGGVTTTLGPPVLTGEYRITSNTCGGTLAASASCSIAVQFAPTASGSQPGSLSIASTTGTPSATASLSGTGQALVLSPAVFSFTTPLAVGSSFTSPSLVTVENLGATPLTLQPLSITGDFSLGVSSCGTTLPPDSSCSLQVTFKPSAGGQRTGSLTVSDGSETQSIQLVGTGLSPATDGLSAGSLSFGATEIGHVSTAQAVMVTNTGDATLAQIAVQATGPFQLANNCGASLGGRLSCSIAVTFAPTALGGAAGVLTIADAQRTQTVVLSGQGIAPPQAFASPSNLDFGPYAQGIGTTPRIVTISNQGVTPMTGTTFSTAGGDFAVSSSSCGPTIAPGASCQIGIVFTPGVIGNREGTLTVASGTLPEPLVVSLAGSGEDYQLSVVGSATGVVTNGQTATYHLAVTPVGASTGGVALACTGVPANAVCTANPSTVSIAGGTTGSVTLTIATAVAATTANTAQSSRWWTGGAALALLCPVFFLRREHRQRFLLVLAAVLLLVSPIACGVHASGVNQQGQTQPGQTPSGSYNITVNATFPGALRTAGVTLVVQ